MSSQMRQQLINEATRYGTGEVLRHMPASYSVELEQAIRQGVRAAVVYHADNLNAVSRPLHSLQDGKAPG